MKCSNCGKELKSSWNMCPYCGQKVQPKTLCPACGEEIEDGWVKCPFCKADLKAPVPDEQSREEENLKRAGLLCADGDFEGALNLYEEYITAHYDRVQGYIGVVRAHSNNYSVYEGEQLQRDINTVAKLSGGLPTEDGEYNAYLTAREKYFADLAKKRAEEEAKRKAEEEAKRKAEEEAAKKRAEEEAKRKAEEEAAKKRAEEETKRKAEEEAAKKRAEEEAKRKAEEEAAQKLAKLTKQAARERARVAGNYSRNGNYITFGLWPQSFKDQHVRIIGAADKDGYYRGDDGNKYSEAGVGYRRNYYKVNPIRWRILEEKNGKALIVCDKIITNLPFDAKSNNYADSEIRKWLNGEFLNKAFSPTGQNKILTVTVDNSAKSTLRLINNCACKNTKDKIFLLSRREVEKQYKLTPDDLLRSPTEYARGESAGVWHNGNGFWWLRSPCHNEPGRAAYVNSDGKIYFAEVGHVSNLYHDFKKDGIVPAMWIKL